MRRRAEREVRQEFLLWLPVAVEDPAGQGGVEAGALEAGAGALGADARVRGAGARARVGGTGGVPKRSSSPRGAGGASADDEAAC
jgi:hypothetical protein